MPHISTSPSRERSGPTRTSRRWCSCTTNWGINGQSWAANSQAGTYPLLQVRQLRQKSFLLATPQGTEKNQQSHPSYHEEIVQAVQPHHPLSNRISNRRKISIISHLRPLLLRRLPTYLPHTSELKNDLIEFSYYDDAIG